MTAYSFTTDQKKEQVDAEFDVYALSSSHRHLPYDDLT